MGTIFLAFVLPALISAIAGIGLGIGQNVSNTKSVESTNQANLEAVRETNASNVEQANLSYQRSLPINQVKNLMDAGFSRAGALNNLTGGGTYTAPVLQSSHGDAPQMDFSSIASSFDRLSDIPSNVEQHKMVQLQRENLLQEMRLRDQEEMRKQELHDYEVWEKSLGKEATTKLNSLASYIVSKAADNGVNLDDVDSIDKLVRTFDLGRNPDWRTMPHIARNQVLQAVQNQHAENRARQAADDAHRAAGDEHQLQVVRKQIADADLDERQKTLIFKLIDLYQRYEMNEFTLDQLQDEKVLRQAGFENKKEAAEAVSAAENLEAKARKDKARFHSQRSDDVPAHIGYSIEWLMDKITPFKGMFTSGR